MPALTPQELRDAIASALSIPFINGEDDCLFTTRCLYSATGRTALYTLWDSERPDYDSREMADAAPPMNISALSASGTVSLAHVWKELDKFLAAFVRLFPRVFGIDDAYINQQNRLAEETFHEMALPADNPSELEYTSHNVDSNIQRHLDIWKRWIISLYLATGFMRHCPMRVGPVIDCAATLNDVRFLRGSHLNADRIHMSGLAMFDTANGGAERHLSDLLLLPKSCASRNAARTSPRVRQTIEALQNGTIAPIRFTHLPSRSNDNHVVRFSIPFELPEEEQNLILLCSWSANGRDLGNMQNRIAAHSLFGAICREMERLGYIFREEP